MSDSILPFNALDEINDIPYNYLTTLPTLNTDLTEYNMVVHGDFPLVVGGETGPWNMQNIDWSEIGYAKTASHLQYPQAWDDTCAGDWWNQAQMDMASAHHMPPNTISSNDVVDELFSQIAADRALYMTPPVHLGGYSAFPLSPLSDPCSTPEPSYSPSNWEAEQNLAHSQISRSPPSVSATSSLFPQSSPGGYSSQATEDEDWFNTLEMPDGSTRRTSNWLPVDSTAGFVIGSRSSRSDHDTTSFCHESQDIKNAFITEQPMEWPQTV